MTSDPSGSFGPLLIRNPGHVTVLHGTRYAMTILNGNEFCLVCGLAFELSLKIPV
jgi:hypothetical protein